MKERTENALDLRKPPGHRSIAPSPLSGLIRSTRIALDAGPVNRFTRSFYPKSKLILEQPHAPRKAGRTPRGARVLAPPLTRPAVSLLRLVSPFKWLVGAVARRRVPLFTHQIGFKLEFSTRILLDWLRATRHARHQNDASPDELRGVPWSPRPVEQMKDWGLESSRVGPSDARVLAARQENRRPLE